ncbi:hypothetical protein VTP01DRAFT_4502 [Rhizomucor pusillus]|uniref:uncharacterized protein n=1 Tax=Rhizomucor pusillus TaxID=4840 RepID=UPI003742F6A0
MPKEMRKQIVIIGDGECGKTSLMIAFADNRFPPEYVPTVFDAFNKDIEIDGRRVNLSLWDTAGQETFDKLRHLMYPDSDVVLVAYSIADPVSLENVRERWVPEVNRLCPGTPFILVGCKKDLRHDEATIRKLANENLSPINYNEGYALKTALRAKGFVECSAKLFENVNLVFEMATRITLKPDKVNACCFL